MANEVAIQRAQARVGTVLKDKWRLDRLLGVGGMASVYAATHRNQKRVAVKMLHPELSSDAQVRVRFLREGYLANTVGHPGAVTIDDDDVTEDGLAFLVMELLEGETLDVRAEERSGNRLHVEEVLGVGDRLLDVLAAAHAKGICHRDIKPDNLFVTKTGVLKVFDFGIAQLREGPAPAAAVTRDGSIMGTPAFMAPEQARGRWDLVDAQTDLWAAGATLYTLLSGRFVHEADTVNEQLALAMMSPAPSLGEVAPHVPPRLVAAIDRAIAYKKTDRWPEARAMQAELRAIAEELMQSDAYKGVSFSLPAPPPTSTPPQGAPARSSFADLGEVRNSKPVVTTANPVSSQSGIMMAASLVPKQKLPLAAAVAAVLLLGSAALVVRAKSRREDVQSRPATVLPAAVPLQGPAAPPQPPAAPTIPPREEAQTAAEATPDSDAARATEANFKPGAPGKKMPGVPGPHGGRGKTPDPAHPANGPAEPPPSVNPPPPAAPPAAAPPPASLPSPDILERRR
jgi:serine/threonine-protein kinase